MKVSSLIGNAFFARLTMEEVFLSPNLALATLKTMELSLGNVIVKDQANLAVVYSKYRLTLFAYFPWRLHVIACIARYFLCDLCVESVRNPLFLVSPKSRRSSFF